ncbi:MAG: arabinogalactan endo-1,4-beta-galactosidase [Treponema sp.]|nr:arabinogalactan endo-1,4-beta-galactosidase [Treponema sp.]
MKVKGICCIFALMLVFLACSTVTESDDDEDTASEDLNISQNADGSTTATASDGTAVQNITNSDGTIKTIITNTKGARYELIRNEKPSINTETWASGFDASSVNPLEVRKDSDGTEKPFFKILADNGVNTVRLRVWVEPYKENLEVNSDLAWSSGSDTAIVIAQAVAAQNAGLKVMIDFHYSDCWADPGKQVIPASWQKDCNNSDQLASKVSSYTTEVLALLSQAGVTPSYVQVGNEINHGMLAHQNLVKGKGVNASDAISGSRQNQDYAIMAKYVKAGCNAVRSFNPNIKIVIHVARSSYNNATIDALMKKGVTNFDIIGYSWYPGYGHGTLKALADDIKSYVAKGKDVMVVETSVPISKGDMSMERAFNNYKENPTGAMYSDLTVNGSSLAYSVENQKNALLHTMEEVHKAGGLGVFTWGGEMGMGNWSMFQNGKALASMEAFNYRP